MIKVQGLSKVFGLPERRASELINRTDGRAAVEKAGGFTAVHDLSFDVAAGELFVVMGLSGSGKSTVIRMLNRLVEPTSGQVVIDGTDVGACDDDQLRTLRNERVNMVFQHFALLPHRTLQDNVAFGLKVRGVSVKERHERAAEALSQVGLGDRVRNLPSELSGGMRQRVGLARALATDADILLMDEPFSALDPLIRKEMQDLLLSLQQEYQKTIVFVTHDLNEAMRLGQRIMVMKSGEKMQLGTGPELLANPANDYVNQFVADVDRSRVLCAGDVMEQPRLCVAQAESPEPVLRRIKDNGCDGAYVVDEAGRLRGVVAADDLQTAMVSGASNLNTCVRSEFSTVPATTHLTDLLAHVGKDVVPVAVLDDDRQLLGVLPRSVLLDALATNDAEVVHHA